MYSDRDTPKGWVSPFGHPRINDCSHLPAAFRSVPRPSSPLGAKASTVRPYHTLSPHMTARTQYQSARHTQQVTQALAPLKLLPTIPRCSCERTNTRQLAPPGGSLWKTARYPAPAPPSGRTSGQRYREWRVEPDQGSDSLAGTAATHRHPLFGDLDLHRWHCLSVSHLRVHRRQLHEIRRRITAELKRGGLLNSLLLDPATEFDPQT